MSDGRVCVFCGVTLLGNGAKIEGANQKHPNSKAKEHVIPAWLQRQLKVEKVVITPKGYGVVDKQRQVTLQRRHPYDALLVNELCSGCNNGWMSELEQSVKPFLTSVIMGKSRISALNATELQVLSRWVVKTALMFSRASPSKDHTVPDHHYHELFQRTDTLPSRVFILGLQLEVDYLKEADWNKPQFSVGNITDVAVISADLFAKGYEDPEVTQFMREYMAVSDASYKITVQIGSLLLLVGFCPDNSYTVIVDSGIHKPLWIGGADLRYYETSSPFALSLMSAPDRLRTFHRKVKTVRTVDLLGYCIDIPLWPEKMQVPRLGY